MSASPYPGQPVFNRAQCYVSDVALKTPRSMPVNDSKVSKRSLEFLKLVADGKSYKDIAELLQTTVGAVNSGMDRLMVAFGTRTRAGAVAFALRRGIIK